jgi:phage tail tape-measure protein
VSSLKTSIVIDLVNRVSEPIRRISRSFEGLRRAAGPAMADVNARASALAGSVGSLAGKLTLLGGAGIWAFKSQFVDTASQFEQFTAILETVEGGSDKARRSMDWVSDFAAKTPYELAEVTDAFVKLRAYGMDPMNGLLKSMGDTSAAMGKPLMQAVEAIADAVTGEYERLKEFGVKADTRGNRVRFNYTDKDGKQQFKTVDKRNRQMIQSTLEAIWNEKYAGAMDKQSRTWRGMVSNLSDQWTRFKVKVMQAGLFDWMKGKLSDLLKLVDKMAADGSLDRYARLWSVNIKAGMLEAWRVGTALWSGFKQIKAAVDKLAEAMGGYDNLLKAVAATIAVNFLVKIGLLTASIVNLAKVVIPALTSSVTALWVAMGPVLAGLAIMHGAKVGSEAIGKAVSEHHVGGIDTERLKEMQGRINVMGGGSESYQSRLIQTELDKRSAKEKISAELKVTFDHKNQNFSVAKLKSSHGFDVDVDTGRTMVAPR